jgi:hypothetical protein
MPKKKPTPQLRRHPIPLGRGGKWWHEQVRRNVRAIFDGLVRKGAPADRATMSRAYAFAIGSLVRYGYLKRHAKGGLYVTEKGLAKSREKLRTPDAKKKHAAYERQLALVRKPRRRRNPEDPAELARRRAAARSREPRELFPDDVEARTHYTVFLVDPMEIIEPYIATQQGSADASLAAAVQAFVHNHADEVNAALRARATNTPYISPAPRAEAPPTIAPPPITYPTPVARRPLRSAQGMLAEASREEVRKRLREITPIGEDDLPPVGEESVIGQQLRAQGYKTPEERYAARREASLEKREYFARPDSYRITLSRLTDTRGKTMYYLVYPMTPQRTGAAFNVRKVTNELYNTAVRDIVRPLLAGYMDEQGEWHPGKVSGFNTLPFEEQEKAIKDYARGRKFDIPEIKSTKLTVEDIANTDFIGNNKDEATRLFMYIHTKGSNLKDTAVPKGWTKIWPRPGVSDPTGVRVYETDDRVAAQLAIRRLQPKIMEGVQLLPRDVQQAIERKMGAVIGEFREKGEAWRQRKRLVQFTKQRAIAELMSRHPNWESYDPEDWGQLKDLATHNALIAAGYTEEEEPSEAGPTLVRGPRTGYTSIVTPETPPAPKSSLVLTETAAPSSFADRMRARFGAKPKKNPSRRR